MHLIFAKRLSFVMQFTNIGTSKIDHSTFKIYGITVIAFIVIDQNIKVGFIEKAFLVPNVNLDIVLELFFLILSNADVNYSKKEL